MKAAYVGLWLSLMSGVAMAQAAPSGAPTTPAPAQQGAATAPGAPQDGGMNAQMQHPAGDPNGGPDEQYEGEIIQTPNGTYMVSEPQRNGEPLRPQAEGDDMEPPGPHGMGQHPHPGHRMPLMSKAAHFRIKGPDLALDVKCPDDEPVKACVDAASQLIDKAGTVHH